MRIEVLCTTMHQKDLSKFMEMNIQTDVIYTNQAHRHSYTEEVIDGHLVKMITTPYRGVGKNRNLGLLNCSADILMFSDDDLVYEAGYGDGVIKAFEELPDADMIIFNCISNREKGTIKNIYRARIWNSMRYGTFSFVIKRESVLRSNLAFSELFGGGSRYCSGEDNLFLREALRKKLKVYTHPYVIARVNHSTSTWFEGFNEKYIYDNGALLQAAFPVLKYILVWYFIIRFSKLSKFTPYKTCKLEFDGMKAYREGLSYDEWKCKKD